MMAVKGVVLAEHFGWSDWVVETDELSVVQAVKNPSPFAMEDAIAETIRNSCSQVPATEINRCPRRANQVADVLVKKCLNIGSRFDFLDAILSF